MTADQIWLNWHTRRANRARQILAEAKNPVTLQSARAQFDWHTAQIRQLERKAEAADKATTLETKLMRT